jgi:hypothetical protein
VALGNGFLDGLLTREGKRLARMDLIARIVSGGNNDPTDSSLRTVLPVFLILASASS